MKTYTIVIFICSLYLPTFASTPYFFGGGYSQEFIQGNMSELNENFSSFNLSIENKYYCSIWWGLNIRYAQLEKLAEAPLNQNYYSELFTLEPNIKYNFLNENDNYSFIPYLKGTLLLGMLDNTDKKLDASVGIGAGLGIAYGFELFNTCMMLDLSANYNSFNALLRANGRNSLNTANINLTFSFCL